MVANGRWSHMEAQLHLREAKNNDDDKRFSVHLPHHWCLQSAIKLLLNWALVHWLIEQPTDNYFDQNKNSRV